MKVKDWLKLALICAAVVVMAPTQAAEPLAPEVRAWLESQTNVTSWSADFVQTRFLKTLTKPLTASGHVWFAEPNKFRWEIGSPAQSIAVRGTNHVLLIYPRLKRVEKYALDNRQRGAWKDALALLEAGFPRSAEDLQKQFEITSQESKDGLLAMELKPRAASARSLMPRMRIEIRDRQLAATELTFADGSRMRNDFSRQETNPTVSPDLFSPQLPDDYKVIEPLGEKR